MTSSEDVLYDEPRRSFRFSNLFRFLFGGFLQKNPYAVKLLTDAVADD